MSVVKEFNQGMKSVTNDENVATLDSRIEDITVGDKAKEINELLNNHSKKGEFDSEGFNKVDNYLDEIRGIKFEYSILLRKRQIKKEQYENKAKKLKETELNLSVYVFNELFKEMYLNAAKIDDLTKEPIPYNKEYIKFAKDYLEKVERIKEIGNELIKSDLLREKYGVKPDEIATITEISFLRTMESKLKYYLNSDKQNVQKPFNLGPGTRRQV